VLGFGAATLPLLRAAPPAPQDASDYPSDYFAQEKARLTALIGSVKARESQDQAALDKSQSALRLAEQLQDSAAKPIAQAAVSKSTQALEKAEQTHLRLEACLGQLADQSELAALHEQVRRTQ
jgi:hypothetical protein